MNIKHSNNLAWAGFLFALGASILFAIRPIFVKLVYAQGVDSTTLIAFRMLFSAPIYAALLFWFLRDSNKRAKLNKSNVFYSALIGLIGYYLASYLDLLGLQYVTTQLGRMILYIYPTFTVVFAAILLGEKITLKTLISLVIAYAGVLIILGHDLNAFGSSIKLGAAFIALSALAFSFYMIFSKSLINEIGSRVFTCITLLSASIAIFIHYSITHSVSNPAVNAKALGLILIIAIFCTVIPTFFTTAAIARIGGDKTSIISMVGPAFTSVFAVLILAESFTIYHLIGICVTTLGVWILKTK